MVADVEVDSALIEGISARYVYIDLEIEQENESIYLIGLDSPEIADEFNKNNFDTLQKWLICLKAQGLKLVGHNFRRFDAKYFFAQYPDLYPWWVIDTLELSVIVKPLQLSHKLHKDYKLSDYAGNNPLEDARASKFLLQELLRDFLTKPLSLGQVYCWLLSCGTEEADFAYKELFNSLNIKQLSQPDLSALPKEAIASWDRGNLDQFWQNAPNESFERRLCVAALMAWEYESNLVNDAPCFSGWLTHLQDFPWVLETFRPLIPLDFSYHPYLENFGLQEFRPIQEEAVQAILGGKRPLLVMATGGGKSLCYQLPALMMYEKQRALTVVISPLQALMADQVADLEAKGLYFATFINGTLTAYERKHRLEQLHRGTKGLLYISPEQLRSISLISLLSERLPVLWIIDEAHCISQWGQTFRPDYRYVPKFMEELYRTKNLPLPRFALMTATATLKVREDIKQLFAQFNLNIGSEIMANGVRENLSYQIIPSNGSKEAQLLNIVQQEYLTNNCTLIYTATRKNAEKLADILKNSGIEARYYHGKISRNEKQEILSAFKQGELNVVTATCAFGMGINRPDVRHVIHHTLSSNLENYVQESGRAGRDGFPATCTILFDENDADLIFFLQSLNHLSSGDLKNIFLSTKSVRGLVYQKAREGEWFWVTVEEIFQRSQLDQELEPEQQDTKIKVALHHLETFGLVQRAENLSTFINFNLQHKTPQQSLSRFSHYSKTYNLTKYQIEEFERLIVAMHALDNYYRQGKISQQIPIELLSDESGIQVQEIKNKIQELKQVGICTFKLPITLLISKRQLISKTTKNDARTNLLRLCDWEERLIQALSEIQKDPASGIQVNLRALTVHLDPDNSQNLRSSLLTDIINGWASQNWLTLKQLSKDIVRLDKIEVNQHLLTHQAIAKCLIEVFYQDLDIPTGDFLKLEYELEELYQRVNNFQGEKFLVALEKLERVLIWLHDRQIIRLTEGLNLLQQALKVRVTPNINIDLTLKRHYQQIEAYYQDEARRTHLMVEYGKLEDEKEREKLVQDYFQLHQTDFESLYPDLKEENAKLPVTQADYNKIIGSLNPSQREIVLAQEAAIAVIAGPGSGKTRTIVHRIAYLVKVKRIPPDRILVLAYNRNAVRELQLRLLDLIGPLAFGLGVFTFHGLALALLGRTLTEEKVFNKEINFEEILNKACDLLEVKEGDDREETQINRLKLLGNLEYIFVDEYQDVAKKEYKLIQLVSGKGVSDDPYRSVEVNLCIIGDDDQNIYQFRGTDVRHIIQFETEYKARQFLLVDNYRSTPSIIKAANNLISHNTQRCKRTPEEQVRIAQSSGSEIDLPVQAYQFDNPMTQAIWVKEKVQAWLDSGVNANEIAILSREWDNLGSIRLLLEREGIVTYALKKDGIKLIRNYVTYRLLTQLEKNPNLIVDSQQSVQDRFKSYFENCGYNLNQPTIKTLLKIAHDLDLERGYGWAENMAIPITAHEIITAIYEYSCSGETYLDESAILVTSYHGAKGLEFRKVILLTDKLKKDESERRLFYVGMTRAKEELILCSTNTNQFISEIGINHSNYQKSEKLLILPEKLLYLDLTPEHIHLGSDLTRHQQQNIKNLQEGEPILIKLNKWHDGWNIITKNNILIGALSKKGVELLQEKNINLGSFNFGLGEVTVKQIFRHLKVQAITGIIEESWFVVIPKIRICR